MERKKKSTAFANRLKASRIKMKLTQAQFCKDYSLFTGRKGILPVSTLSSWEIGAKEPDLKTVERLASFMGVTVDFLIGRTFPLYSNKPVFLHTGQAKGMNWEYITKGLMRSDA